jgi:hypothetical protein
MRHGMGRSDPRRAALVLLALAFGGSSILTAPAARAQSPVPQPVATADENATLSQAQLEQLLAPVALFPDELLMQLLMAATYPLEIVQAQRWLGQGQNAALQGDALAQALQAQSWDPSVKSLMPFPDLVKMMSDQLAWTQQLGDAVLAQQEDVLNAVQVLRGRAQAAGKLESGPQQTVTVTQNVTVAPATGGIVAAPPQIITIAPTNPEVVFVPAYDPNVVFGTWPWPSYPPVFIPPPVGWGVGNALLTGMAFATGAAVVGSLWGWARPAWGRGYANINVNRFNSINVNRTQINNNRWQHDVSHRHGVAYSNREVSNRFRGDVNANRNVNWDVSREQFRGRAEQIQRDGGLGANRPGGGDRPNLGANRPGADGPGLGANRPGGGDRPNLGANRPGGDGPGLGANRPGGGDRPNLGANRPGGDGPGLGANRPGGGDRPNLGANRPSGGPPPVANRPGGGQGAGVNRPTTLPSGRPQVPQQRPQTRPAGLDGMGQGRDVRAAAQRGQASRQAPPVQRQQIQQRADGARQAAPARQGGGGARGGGPHGGGGRHGR